MNFDFTKDIILEDERVRIRPMETSDRTHLKELLLDPDLSLYSLQQVHGPAGVDQYIDQCLSDRSQGIRYPFTFFDKKSNAYAGTSCFGQVSNAHKRLEVGWTKIAKPFQGTGLNTHCKYLMFQYAFETLVANRVELKTHAENITSRKAMEKVGATYEGLLRHHMIMENGSLRNTVYFSILKAEWPSVKKRLEKLMHSTKG